jgi:hypothetical protein
VRFTESNNRDLSITLGPHWAQSQCSSYCMGPAFPNISVLKFNNASSGPSDLLAQGPLH